ncbi:MAG: HesA/MoeB/ThiF family protein [Pseudomonadota bacterium]
MALAAEDLERHARHILLKEIGGPGVAKLKAASVSIVGAGALGGPCALYLAAAGVGRIEILDDDHVDRSNLQRQIQFSNADIGKSKAELLARRLEAMDPAISTAVRAERFVPGSDLSGRILIDACDNYETRYALNELAHASGRPLVSGAAARWSGQVSVFASGVEPGAPCYRCFTPEIPPDGEACDDIGVVGAVTGVAGARMALETLKLITGAGDPLIGRVWLLDGLSGDSRVVRLRQDTECPVCAPVS